jgi:2-polyprenyl-3-methyl-5-hydroxy-6-metoxy-1,4-benzoquinol methylase
VTEATSLHLPGGYLENPPASADSAGTPFWEGGLEHNDVRYQVPVYRLAVRRARQRGCRTIVDIGCGSGDKLARHFEARGLRVVGVDQESAIRLARRRFRGVEWTAGDLETDAFWEELRQLEPDMVICADVIEHLVDPVTLLHRLRDLVADGLLLLSTPDRSRLVAPQSGPPLNPRHIREWSAEELSRLVQASGFTVLRHHHLLPRQYSISMLEFKRLIYRALHAQAIPDRRSCQAMELVRT